MKKSILTLSALLSVSLYPTALADCQFLFTPYDDAETPYLAMLNSAQKSVMISIYGFTDPQIVDKLIELKKRGVGIRMCMDKTQAAGKTERLQVARLKRAGIDMVIGTSSKKHAINHDKYTIVDGIKVETGSWNYSPSASNQNNTVEFITDDKSTVNQFTKNWNEIHDFMETQQ